MHILSTTIAHRLAGVDERTLALFRAGLALVVLVDLAIRSLNLIDHYSDVGAIPRLLVGESAEPAQIFFPLYFLHGSALWSAFLFLLTAVAAAALFVGFRTPWAAAFSCYLVFCLHARAPSVTHGGDDLLRLLLLWAIFLPLGRFASLDARRVQTTLPPQVVSIATFAAQLHLTALFWLVPLSGAPGAKSLLAPTSLTATLATDALVTSWGSTLRTLPDVVDFGEVVVGGLGLLAPFMLWSPILIGPLRALFVLGLLQLEILGVAPALHLGIQPWVVAVAATLFLPGWIWNQMTESTRSGEARVPARRRLSIAADAAAALVLLLVLTTGGLTALAGRDPIKTASMASSVANRIGVGLPRSLLLPAPEPNTGWLVTRGLLEDGRETDVWRRSDLTFDKPLDVARSQGGSRWRAHLATLVSSPDPDHHSAALLSHLCRSWNDSGEHPGLVELELVFMLDRRDPESGERPALPVPLGSIRCDG